MGSEMQSIGFQIGQGIPRDLTMFVVHRYVSGFTRGLIVHLTLTLIIDMCKDMTKVLEVVIPHVTDSTEQHSKLIPNRSLANPMSNEDLCHCRPVRWADSVETRPPNALDERKAA